MKNLMWRLLRRNVSVGQMGGFAIANLVGLTIVVLAIQFYADVRPIFDDRDSFIRKDYLVITRQVNGIGSLLGDVAQFEQEDIDDLAAQPWVNGVGVFTSSDYEVYAQVALAGSSSFGTELFFESVPDNYIDVEHSRWSFDPEKGEVPVIVSKDYLSLYNFGFAPSQGLPQISEAMVGMVPLQFTFSGEDCVEHMRGRIVGFSNRINSILVPQEFMEWSNARYCPDAEPRNPSRLIVEVNTPGDTRIEEYMSRNGYDVSGDKMNSSKATYFLTIIIGIVVFVGVIISALSFFVLTLSVYLLLQKNSRKMQTLMLLGYSPWRVSAPYIIMECAINAAVFVGAVVLMLVARNYYASMLESFGIADAGVALSVAIGATIIFVITVFNAASIYRKVRALWWQ